MRGILHLCADAQESFSYAATWVEKIAQQSAQSKKLSVVVLPHQEMAIQLRKVLASRKSSFINIHFWTPERLRSQLLQEESPDLLKTAIASREELQLILSSIASNFFGANEDLIARAIEGNPALLLRILDMLDGAGLHARIFEGLEEVANLAEAFYAALEKQELRTVSATDRLLASRERASQFKSLLIFGFHGAHWPLFPLLAAAGRAAEKLEVLFDAPRDVSFDLDSAWVGTWEEILKVEALPLENEDPEEKNLNIQEQMDRQELSCVEFLAEDSTRDLAEAIARRAAEMVGEGAKSVSVVFSAYGALSREVALALKELEIPHFDAIGHTFLESGEVPLWQSWCNFQRFRTVQAFAKFLALLPDHGRFLKLLREASRETLSQDIRICMEFVRIHNGKEEAGLAAYSLLPTRASFAEFCEITDNEFNRMTCWKQAECLRERRERFYQAAELFIGCDVFLRWLQTALRNEYRKRDPMGSHPYATIQLLRRDQAALCPWTHVILAGMNAGEWPEPVEESGLLPADAIADFNRQINFANCNAQTQGIFGEGHLAVTRIPCLGPHERNLLQRRDFQSLRQVPYLVATVRLKNDTDSAIPSRPSLWFSELFHEVRGKPPLLADLQTMIPPRERRDFSGKVEEVSAVRSARLDSSAPFGPWEFSTYGSVKSPSSLAVVDIERLLYDPAAVWMKTFLGVESPEEERISPWIVTVGIWTHRWLRNICQPGWKVFPDKDSRGKAVLSASEVTRTAVERACRALQKPAPPWWRWIWEQARSFAVQFSDQLEVFRPRFSLVATETSFRDVHFPPLALYVRGRWDLVLCNQTPNRDEAKPFSGLSVLVIDYKTGKDLKISSMLRDGTGIQLALYASAALALGAQRVDAAWITPDTSGEVMHLPFEELEKIHPILLAIGRMILRGTFGMRGELRSEFTFRRPMPLATLSIPPNILEAKWKLTHGFEEI